jgi:hypothetical protein
MRSGNRFGNTFLLGAPVLAALSLILSAGGSAAQGVQGGKTREPQAVSNQQLRQAIQVLRSAKTTLEMADHDYGGHRAAAVRDIKAAIHQLRLALANGHKKTTAPVGKNPGPVQGKGPRQREPQAVSDQQLADSIPVLRQTISVLQNANHDYGGHRARAVRDLQAAVRQLEVALKYSRQNNQNKT